jgi:hypothetical protein
VHALARLSRALEAGTLKPGAFVSCKKSRFLSKRSLIVGTETERINAASFAFSLQGRFGSGSISGAE